MIYIASLLGFGDSLITCSLLERSGRAGIDVRIAGTSVTKGAASLLRTPPPISEELFRNAAAFYTIRSRGFSAALQEAMRFRRWALTKLTPEDTLILERQGLRNKLLIPRGTCSVLEVPRSRGVYFDREAALRPYIGEQQWPSSPVPIRAARRVVINPSSRVRAKSMAINEIDAVLRAARTAGAEVSLIDAAGRYEVLRDRVQSYLKAPSLHDASIELRNSDGYVGPDSFFTHLAYYYRVPFFTIYHVRNTYFAPPGSIEQGNFTLACDGEGEVRLTEKIQRFLLPDK